MKNLTIEDLAMYLPYKLKVQFPKTDHLNGKIVIMTPHRMGKEYVSIRSTCSGYKPILHPLSDLTKKITVEGYNDGEAFVPIVELAKIAYCKLGKGSFKLVDDYVNFSSYYSFHFVKSEISFDCRTNWNGKRMDYNCYVPNQFKLFQLLAKWHFWLGDQSMFGKEIIEIKTLKL